MATTYWDKVVCTDGSAIENIEWSNIVNVPSGTYTIVGTANQIDATVDGLNQTVTLSLPTDLQIPDGTTTVLNSQNKQSVSGTDYNTYADSSTDPGDIQYFTRLSTYRSSTNIATSGTIPLWQFTPIASHTYSIKVLSIISASGGVSSIERGFIVGSNGTTTSGGMNIIGTIPSNISTTTNVGTITFNLAFPLVPASLTAPINISTRIEVLRTLA